MAELRFPTIPADAAGIRLDPQREPLFFCLIGGHYKPKDQFHTNRSIARGITASCKDCVNARWRANNPPTQEGRKPRRHPKVVAGVTSIRCSACETYKPLADFRPRRSKPGKPQRYMSHCIACERERGREAARIRKKYQPEALAAASRNYSNKRREDRQNAREDAYQRMMLGINRLRTICMTHIEIGPLIEVNPVTVKNWIEGRRPHRAKATRVAARLEQIIEDMPSDAFLGPVERPERRKGINPQPAHMRAVGGHNATGRGKNRNNAVSLARRAIRANR